MIAFKVLRLKYRLFSMKTICYFLLAIALSLSLIGCEKLELLNTTESVSSSSNISSQLAETAPPKLIQELKKNLTSYKPEVNILFPQSGTTLQTTSTDVQLSVQDLPLFQDKKLGLGFNLHLILDNEPYIPIYNLDEPIQLKNLTLGTHTLRIIACLPWHESFKTQGAYAETTFNVVTETEDNYPDFFNKPLLTYSNPQGNYSAEPIMLDFYIHDPEQKNLTPDKPLSNPVKITINEQSFIVDQWQPIYLKGFQEGNNLVQLELIDSEGNKINNVFNKTVRLITYKPDSSEPLAKLVTNQISLEKAQAIIDPNYYVKLAEEAKPELEIETDQTLPEQESEVIEESLTVEESDNSVVEEPILDTVQNNLESAEVMKSEITESEVEPLQLMENDNFVESETISKTEDKI